MSGELVGIVVAHGTLAEALVRAAESISGVRDALLPVSNAGCDRAALEARLCQALNGRAGVVFVDLPTGSCFVAAMRALGTQANVRVVTGVNLTMLLDFLFHRGVTLDQAVARAGETGARAISGR